MEGSPTPRQPTPPEAGASKNVLYYGDNLPILRNWDYFPGESIDLVYLDPPFNSNQDYNVLFAEQDGSRSAAQIQAFTDTWRWDASARRTFDEAIEQGGKAAEALAAFRSLVGESDMLAYLSMMAPRLVELRRVMKQTGSIYLHCDPTAGHYLKLLMDAVFGTANFRNEIIWYYYNKIHDRRKKLFARANDAILFYVKDGESDFTFHQLKEKRDTPVRQLARKKVGGRMVNAKDEAGHVIYRMSEERTLDNVWRIPCLQPAAYERLGFPTQKPESLLERIIIASSDPGDTVLDPFCGCGTTIAAAQGLGRRWIGIDVTHLAITLIRSRLTDAYGVRASYIVVGEPADVGGAEALAKQDRYQFQWWALGKISGRPVADERKKGADSGIDGKLFFREKEGGVVKTMVIQVKSGGLKLSEVRDFARVIEREKAQIGVLITLDEPTRDMKTEAASMGYYKPEYRLSADDKYDKYQILSVRQLFEGAKPQFPPFRNVTFKAAPEAPPTKAKPKGRIKKLSLPGFAGQGVLRAEEGEPETDPEDPAET